jgi:hypothetical protein
MPQDIQFKRSLTTVAGSLLFGQPSWTDNNSSLYIGNSSGVPVLINKNFFVFHGSRNANVSTDQSLRREEGTFISTTPYIVPYNSVIYKVSAENENINNTRTWQLVIEQNATVILTLTKPNTSNKIVSANLNLTVSVNDELVMYFRNASGIINKPGGIIYGRSV